MAGSHAKLSASKSERFMECPGSVALEKLCPPEAESEFAAEGTAAHALAEKALSAKVDAWDFIGEQMYTSEGGVEYVADAEMAMHVQGYLDFVRTAAGDRPIHVELSLADEELGEDVGGTSDCVINGYVTPDKDGNAGFIQIIDLKYGAGVPVEVEGNSQLRYYGYLTLRKFGITKEHNVKVGLTVYQPRCEHHEGPARTEWMNSKDLIYWAETELLPAFDRVRDGAEDFRSGDHCRWCPAKLICPTLRDAYAECTEVDPGDFTVASDEQLAIWYEKIGAAETFIKAVNAECFKRAMDGAPVSGTGLFYGRSPGRVWKDGAEEAAIDRFGEDAYTEPTLKSPAQLSKISGGKKFAEEFSYKQEGKPTLKPSTHRGVPYDIADRGAGFAGIDTGSDE